MEERIKFRKLAQIKLEMTTKQIEDNIEKNDFKNFQYCGWSYEILFKSKFKLQNQLEHHVLHDSFNYLNANAVPLDIHPLIIIYRTVLTLNKIYI